MRKLLVAALLVSQFAAAPAEAAELPGDGTVAARQLGTFAGARLRVPFGGKESGKPRAALALTPMKRGQFVDGRSRMQFGEGLELSLSEGRPATLRLGGVSFSQRLAAAQGAEEQEKRRGGTGRKILKGVAVVAIIGVAVIGGLFLAYTIACDDNRCSE